MEKVSVFIEMRVLFWQEISALGVFLIIDNKRMRPPNYPSAPHPREPLSWSIPTIYHGHHLNHKTSYKLHLYIFYWT